MFKTFKKLIGSTALILMGAAVAIPSIAWAISTYMPIQGGTGTSGIPTTGQLLVGTGTGVYTPTTTIPSATFTSLTTTNFGFLTGATSTAGYCLQVNGSGTVYNAACPIASIQTYMFTSTTSDVSSTYHTLTSLDTYVSGPLATITTNINTTSTLMGVFATNIGYPNLSVIPVGLLTVHYDTQKAAGANNYYTYASIYKVSAGGVETLLQNTDVSTQTSVNTIVNQTVVAPVTSSIFLVSTDRIIVKVYGVLLTASANVTLRYDDTTSARLELPSPLADVTNFVPYSGATKSVNLGAFGLTTTNLGFSSIASSSILFTGANGVVRGNSTSLSFTGTNVGIGKNNPAYPLDVNGAINSHVTNADANFIAYSPAAAFPRAQFQIGNNGSDTNVNMYVAPLFSSAGVSKPAGITVATNKDATDATEQEGLLYVNSTATVIASLNKDTVGGTPNPLFLAVGHFDGSARNGIIVNNDANNTVSIGSDTTSTAAQLVVSARSTLKPLLVNGTTTIRVVAGASQTGLTLDTTGNWSTGQGTGIIFKDSTGITGAIANVFDGTYTNLQFGGLYNGGYGSVATPVMTLTGSGNEGVGTTTPNGKLAVVGNANGAGISSNVYNTNATGYSAIRFGQDGVGAVGGTIHYFNSSWSNSGNAAYNPNTWNFTSYGAGGYSFATNLAAPIKWYQGGLTTSSEKMRIDTNGNLGIGTTTPANLVSVSSAATTTMFIDSTSATKGTCLVLKDAGSASYTFCTTNAGTLSCSTVDCR